MSRFIKIVYPAPAPDLVNRMADALAPLSDGELNSMVERLDQYALALGINDILALRGATFRKLDAAAHKAQAERRTA